MNKFSPYNRQHWKVANVARCRIMGAELLDDYLKLEALFDKEKTRSQVGRRKVNKERYKLDEIGKQQTKATTKWATLGGLAVSVGVGLWTGDLSILQVLQGGGAGLAAGGFNGVVKYLAEYKGTQSYGR